MAETLTSLFGVDNAAVAIETGVAQLIPHPDAHRDCGGDYWNQDAG